jgi:hypothetical protein
MTRFEELLNTRRTLEELTVDNIIAMNRLNRLDQEFNQRVTRMKKLARERAKAMAMDKIAAE